MIELDKIYNEDCLTGMQRIPDGSVDCIICDLPYGTTQNKWDAVIPFEPLWEQYLRIAKENAAIVLFSQMPFTCDVVNSMRKYFRYELIWKKSQGSGFLNANKMPLKIHENILLFYRKLPTYNMQKTESSKATVGQVKSSKFHSTNYREIEKTAWTDDGKRCPTDIIYFDYDPERHNSKIKEKDRHPTQKPVDLIAYLIRTYSNEGDTILDNCMGSGTTAIAAIKEKRHFIGFEMNGEYYAKSLKRIEAEKSQLALCL